MRPRRFKQTSMDLDALRLEVTSRAAGRVTYPHQTPAAPSSTGSSKILVIEPCEQTLHVSFERRIGQHLGYSGFGT